TRFRCVSDRKFADGRCVLCWPANRVVAAGGRCRFVAETGPKIFPIRRELYLATCIVQSSPSQQPDTIAHGNYRTGSIHHFYAECRRGKHAEPGGIHRKRKSIEY